jgi:uncharacterized protein (DUF4415 family)
MKKQKEKIVRYTSEDLEHLEDRSDWAKVDALTDEEIEKAIDEDPDAAPRLDSEWFKEAVWRNYSHATEDEEKERITIRLDKDVLDFFKQKGKGYQSRINNALRAFVKAQQGHHT